MIHVQTDNSVSFFLTVTIACCDDCHYDDHIGHDDDIGDDDDVDDDDDVASSDDLTLQP